MTKIVEPPPLDSPPPLRPPARFHKSSTFGLLILLCVALVGVWFVVVGMPGAGPRPTLPPGVGSSSGLPLRPSVAADMPPDALSGRPDRPVNPNAPQFEDLNPAAIQPTVQALLERWHSASAIHAVVRCLRTSRPPTSDRFDRCEFEIWKQGDRLRVDIRGIYPDQALLNLVFPGATQGFAWIPKIGGWAPMEAKNLDDFIASMEDTGDTPPFSFRELDLLQLLLSGEGLSVVPDSRAEPAEACRRTYPSNGNVTILYFQYAGDLSESVEVGLTQPDNGLMGIYYKAPAERPRRIADAEERLPRARRTIGGSELQWAINIQSHEFDVPVDATIFERPLTATMRYHDFYELAVSVEKNRLKK